MPAPEVVDFLLRPLNAAGIPYMVTGGLAAILYGEPRLTNDVDVVVDLHAGDVERLLGQFDPGEYYVPPIETVREEASHASRGHFNLLHRERALRADVYVLGEDAFARWALPRRRTLSIGDEPIPVAPIEYVILMKLEYARQSGSDRHRRDIAAMLRQSGETVDYGVMAEWSHRLDLVREWEFSRDLRLR